MCSQVPCGLSPQLVEPYGSRRQGSSTIYPNWDGQDERRPAEACWTSGEAGAGLGVGRTGGTIRRCFSGFSLHSLSSATSQGQLGLGTWGPHDGEGDATSCSGSSTGPEYTVGCTSASLVHTRQTRVPSHSPEREPGKGERASLCHTAGMGELGHLPAQIYKPPPPTLYLAYEDLGCCPSCPRC